jgi:RNA polymerase sigma-70 factor (ECF subfamily)
MVAVAVRPERLPLGKVAVVDEDEVLVARLAAGDDDAMGELFDRYGPFVLGLARRVSRSTQVAEDVAQDVLTALWSDPSRFDPNRGSLRAFLGVQAYRRAVDAMRRDSRRRAREEHVVLPELGCASMDGRDAIEAATLAEVVRGAIKRLPADQRAAVELVFWKGLTCREVARVLAIPEGTAKSRLRLAQSKLSEWLAPLSGEPV